MKSLLMPGMSWVLPENVPLFVFRSSANSSADTSELLVSKDDKGPCARGAFRHKAAFSSAQTKTALCHSHVHHHLTPKATVKQTACFRRQKSIFLTKTSTNGKYTTHKQMAQFGTGIVYNTGALCH